MKQRQKHVPEGGDLGENNLHRIGRNLPRGLESLLAHPLGQSLAVALGGGLDLGQLLGREPRGDGFGAERAARFQRLGSAWGVETGAVRGVSMGEPACGQAKTGGFARQAT